MSAPGHGGRPVLRVPPKPHVPQGVPLISSPQVTLDGVCNFAGVGPGDVACDVGCGLGGFCVTAARRGAEALGLDIAEDYLEQARGRAAAEGLEERCAFRRADFTEPDFEVPAAATVVYVYLLPWALELLEPALRRAIRRGCRVVSFQFHLPGLQPQRVGWFGAFKLYTDVVEGSGRPLEGADPEGAEREQDLEGHCAGAEDAGPEGEAAAGGALRLSEMD